MNGRNILTRRIPDNAIDEVNELLDVIESRLLEAEDFLNVHSSCDLGRITIAHEVIRSLIADLS